MSTLRAVSAVPVDDDVRIEQSFAPSLDAPVRAAQTLDALSSTLSADALEALRWVTYELVSNALKYSGASPGQTIDLTVREFDRSIRIEVRDPGCFEPDAPPRNPRGWGLHVIGRLADRWGVTRWIRSTTVWVEVDIPTAVAVDVTRPEGP